MVGEGILDPTPPGVQRVGFGQFGRHPRVVPRERKPAGRHGHGQEGLVHGHLGGEAYREVGSGQRVRDLAPEQRRSEEMEGAGDGAGGAYHRTAMEEPRQRSK